MEWDLDLPCTQALCVEERAALRSQLEHRFNTPLTSSMGRLFDAAAALIGVRQKVNYEAQAAIELEALADTQEKGAYPFEITNGEISPASLWAALAGDFLAGVPLPILSARFHNSVTMLVSQVCLAIRKETGIQHISLSGGVWQNFTLLSKTLPLLQAAGFTVYLHRQLPPNDGCLALGQAVIAYHTQAKGIGVE
jgi:hydrogenase maturation protein HypF